MAKKNQRAKATPEVQEPEEDDLAKEDYEDKDKFVVELAEDDEEETVEEGTEEEEPSAAIDVPDDW